MLGWSSRKHPDWFIAAENILRPLIDKCNQLFLYGSDLAVMVTDRGI